jgi:hypothetical protein
LGHFEGFSDNKRPPTLRLGWTEFAERFAAQQRVVEAREFGESLRLRVHRQRAIGHETPAKAIAPESSRNQQ